MASFNRQVKSFDYQVCFFDLLHPSKVNNCCHDQEEHHNGSDLPVVEDCIYYLKLIDCSIDFNWASNC